MGVWEYPTKEADERKSILDETLQLWAQAGWRIESRSDFQAQVASGKTAGERTASFGLAGFFLGPRVKRTLLTVDEYGDVHEQQVSEVPNALPVPCQECRRELASDSPELRLELTSSRRGRGSVGRDGPVVSACEWERVESAVVADIDGVPDYDDRVDDRNCQAARGGWMPVAAFAGQPVECGKASDAASVDGLAGYGDCPDVVDAAGIGDGELWRPSGPRAGCEIEGGERATWQVSRSVERAADVKSWAVPDERMLYRFPCSLALALDARRKLKRRRGALQPSHHPPRRRQLTNLNTSENRPQQISGSAKLSLRHERDDRRRWGRRLDRADKP
jgi:hypothetical protein